MKYRLVKIELNEAKDRLNRCFYIKENANLLDAAVISLNSMLCAFDHMFEFESKDHSKKYKLYSSMLDCEFNDESSMAEVKIQDVNEPLTLCYDMGECWDFNVEISKESIDLPNKTLYVFKSGKGLALWEDRKCTFFDYIEGKVDKNLKYNKSNEIYFPVNVNMRVLSEQDQEITSELINNDLMTDINKILKNFKKMEEEAKVEYLSYKN